MRVHTCAHTHERVRTHTHTHTHSLSHTFTDLAACPLLGLTWTMSSSCVSLTRPTKSLRQLRERMWSSLAPPSLVSELVLKLVNFDPLDGIQLSSPSPHLTLISSPLLSTPPLFTPPLFTPPLSPITIVFHSLYPQHAKLK